MLAPERTWQRLPFQRFDEEAEPATKKQFDEAVAYFMDGNGANED